MPAICAFIKCHLVISLSDVCSEAVGFGCLHDAAAQSQMCEEPFKAAITITANVTFPISASSLDPNLVFYRKVLRFTEEEIDRDRETAMHFFKDMYGLDFTSIELNDQGQRILGNATFEPTFSQFNFTYVFNSWLVYKWTAKDKVLSSIEWWLLGMLFRSNVASWRIWWRRRKIGFNK